MIAAKHRLAVGLFLPLSLLTALGCGSERPDTQDELAPDQASLIRVDNLRPVDGSGVLMLQRRHVAPFTSVTAERGITLSVKESHGQPAMIAIGADDNLVPLIETEVQNRVLRVRLTGSVRTDHPLWVDVIADDVETI